MYPSTKGRCSATIGCVAPTPNHVHKHNVQQSEIECTYSSACMCAMNKMFKGKAPQGHKPQIPQREHPRERPTKVGPHFAQETTHSHSPPHHRPKKRSRNPPPTPTPTATSSSWHTKSSRSQQRLVIQGCSPRSLGRLPRHCLHSGTLCPHDIIVYPCELFPNHVRLGPLLLCSRVSHP